MQTLEFDTEISQDHEIHIDPPAHIGTGKAHVIVIHEQGETAVTGNLDAFLGSLPLNATPIERREIMDRLNEERASWE